MRRDSTGGARRLSGRSTAPLPRVGQVETPSHYVQESARERDHRQRDMTHSERNRPDRQTCAELDELRQLCLLAHERD
jgi:hypothetical protein